MNVKVLRDLGLEEVDMAPGALLIKEGERSDRVFVLIGGSVRLSVDGHQIATVDSPGTVFGEISALLSTTPSATVTTVEESSFYLIPDFMEFIHEHPDACVSVAQILACRLVNMNNHFVHMREQVSSLQKELENYIPVFPETFDTNGG